MVEGTVDIPEIEKLRPSICEEAPNIVLPTAIHRRRILLEPALVGAMMAINLASTSLYNFYLYTACTVDLGNPVDLCKSGGPGYEMESQKMVSGVNISRTFVGSILSTVILLFVGPWSDCSGRRKPLLVVALLGMSAMTTGVLLMVTFPGASTAQVLYAVQIPMSMGGNFGLLLAAAFSHIGDVCHATGRDVTRAMGGHRAAIQIAHVTGSVGGPLLFRRFGYYGVFPIVLTLQLLSLLYVIFFVEDVNVNVKNKVSVFNWRLPLNAVHCLLKPREGRKRVIILLMLVVALGDRVILSTEVLLSYLFYRYKFDWTDVIYGSFLAYRNIASFLGTLLILTVLKRRLKLSDELIGALSCTSYIIATAGLMMATTTAVVFCLPLIGIISQGSQVVQRPLINKQILPTEQGKIYSILGALESATQTFTSPLYALLYVKTISTMPEAWLIPGIVLVAAQLLAYLLTRRLRVGEEKFKIKNIELASAKKTKDSKDKNNEEENDELMKEALLKEESIKVRDTNVKGEKASNDMISS